MADRRVSVGVDAKVLGEVEEEVVGFGDGDGGGGGAGDEPAAAAVARHVQKRQSAANGRLASALPCSSPEVGVELTALS